MVGATSVSATEIEVDAPRIGRDLRSDLSTSADCDTVGGYDAHER